MYSQFWIWLTTKADVKESVVFRCTPLGQTCEVALVVSIQVIFFDIWIFVDNQLEINRNMNDSS